MNSFIRSCNLYAGKFTGIIQVITLALLLFGTLSGALFAGDPLTYGFDSVKAGDPADTTNDQVTVPFSPTSVAICNDSTSVTLITDLSDGVAADTSNSTNNYIAPEECWVFNTSGRNALDTLVIGLITASSTAEYRVTAYRIQ